MNKTKGEIMNNFKKIGLTALAGSLAAVSANAVELSVSGETTVSYISNTAAKVNTLVDQVLVHQLELLSVVQEN
jgi:outer membrane protein OmpU